MRWLLSISILLVLAGVANGVHETLNHHYSVSLFPQKGERGYHYWSPKASWRNKWKNGDKAQGEAFFLSSTILVFLTDAYHLTKWLYHGFFRAAMVVFGIFIYGQLYHWNKSRQWLYGIAAWFVLAGIQALGFHLMYTLILV